MNLQWDRQQKTLYLSGQLIASLIIMAVLIYQKAIEESQCNFHFHECTGYTFSCDDRGLRARFIVNLQWHRHKKTLYLGDQLIAPLIIMAEVHQKSNRRKCTFHFHEFTSYTFVKTEDWELDLMWIWKEMDIKGHYISATSFELKSCIVAVVNFCVFVVGDFLLVNNRFLVCLSYI